MSRRTGRQGQVARKPAPCRLLLIAAFLSAAAGNPAHGAPSSNDAAPLTRTVSLAAGQRLALDFGALAPGATYRLTAVLKDGPIAPAERVRIELHGSAGEQKTGEQITKDLHAGDPDFYLPYRSSIAGRARLVLLRPDAPPQNAARALNVQVEWRRLELGPDETSAIEAEPNDSWKQANDLRLGRDVYGTADDVDYLENPGEGATGIDWFQFKIDGETPRLVYFQLDLLDRDVAANLRTYTVDAQTGKLEPYERGKGPMEIVHDRERERYSKHISRTFTKGTYYLEVNANHPHYVLRTRVLPAPPYDDPALAVEAGAHYLINVGDAWFAQVPRAGDLYVRSGNLHETSTRCTACHPSSFPTEAGLAAHRNGYPIRSKSNFQYVMDRLSNSIAPLYGGQGLYWQRFIATPLEAQGLQGGILLDFERQVSKRPSPATARFAPFARAAWMGRDDLPEDEQNGVIPLDSKFELAWRDWSVLKELGRRDGRADWSSAAEHITAILSERAADFRAETLQDRIHRIHAWSLINRGRFANKIRRETGALLSLQNADGGWHEVDTAAGPSAVYTTGQLIWTLLRAGVPRDDPALARGLRYLLSQQQDFGGWIQTTTHENFRTPMRETRYAVMALAEAFPRPGAPLSGWGNRDDGAARPPRTDSMVHTLDDLENLWDVPEENRPEIESAAVALLGHPEPLVRAAAAACLGRIGGGASVGPLAGRLGDRSKIVWRAAAWALRRLGNQGIGHDAIAAALKSPDPATRRGAARIFAYQFYGMDEDRALIEPLFALCGDADLWTRLQAARTLRQWFYRTSDLALARRIVATYLARLDVEDAPVVRKALCEGLYIMLDENLGGGVSLQRNLAELPEPLRDAALSARKAFEYDVLLAPLLAALKSGGERRRAGVLAAFDGSFLKGRGYARRPSGAVDVGNDRDFGFLYEPKRAELEAAFGPLLEADLPAVSRARAVRLASFFRLPELTQSAEIQGAFLRRLSDPDEAVRAAACDAVARELDLNGVESDPDLLKSIVAALKGPSVGRAAMLRAIGRSERLVQRPEVLAALRPLMNHGAAAASLLPVLHWPVVSDVEVAAIARHAWPRLDPAGRAEAIEALMARPKLVNVESPRILIIDLLRRGATDPSFTVRERTLRGLLALSNFVRSENTEPLLLAALADDAPSLRLLGFQLAAFKTALGRNDFWKRPDAREHLKRLLIDPNLKIREAALGAIWTFNLVDVDRTLAPRVKALADDPNLAKTARAVLEKAGIRPEDVKADAHVGRPRLLSFSTFRRAVNPIFYERGPDGHSCSECHGNHTILRIAPAPSPAGGGGPSDEDPLVVNYMSALKVLNLGDPESSLLLRKPRSPRGQGGPDPSSPTGMTHVGGPRWEGVDHPAYRAVLAWAREAAASSSADATRPTADAKYSADSYSPKFAPVLAGDGDVNTLWRTEFTGNTPGYPHALTVDLGRPMRIEGALYVPRQDSSLGRPREYEVRVSSDGTTWSDPLAHGRWDDGPAFQFIALPEPVARYVQLRGLSEVEGRPEMCVAEFAIESAPAPAPARTKTRDETKLSLPARSAGE